MTSGDRFVGLIFEVAETDDIPLGFKLAKNPVGAGKRLDKAVVFEVFIDVEGIDRFGIKAGQEHVDH